MEELKRVMIRKYKELRNELTNLIQTKGDGKSRWTKKKKQQAAKLEEEMEQISNELSTDPYSSIKIVDDEEEEDEDVIV